MRYFYLREESGLPSTCVASELVNDDKTVRFAISTYNPVDRFSKKEARDQATERLNSGNYFSEVPVFSPFTKRFIVEMLATLDAPLRTKQAAALWLSNYWYNASKNKRAYPTDEAAILSSVPPVSPAPASVDEEIKTFRA